MSTIPASEIVRVIPGVLSAGGNALDLNGLFLTDSDRIATADVQGFPTALAVGQHFGSTSTEKSLADKYFAGFTGSTQKPGNMMFARYNQADCAAWIRSANLSASMSLTQLKALSGDLTATVDGVARVATALSLASATSFTAAAALIEAGLNASPSTLASFTGEISGTTLTASSVTGGTLSVGQLVVGAGVAASTVITALGTGTGLDGTYEVSVSQTVASESMTTEPVDVVVSYDSILGSFVITSGITGAASTVAYCTSALATSLKLTSATGATLSQGAAAAVPATLMDAIIALTQNWASFTTTFDPDLAGENTVKLEFSAWNNAQSNRYAYVAWDTDQQPTVTDSAATSLGPLLATNEYSGVCAVYAPDAGKAAFIMGFAASLDFQATNGRATLKFKTQDGLTADVTDVTAASNLAANGYNFVGAYATANDEFVFCAEGVISGDFQWFDTYINQIWLNNQLQLALVNLLVNEKSIPYNRDGYAKIEAAALDPILTALNFGAIRAGVTLSESQKSTVNSAAGKIVDPTITRQGWYLQVLDATPIVRQARGTPPCNLWYADGESVHQITLSSIAIQ